MSARDESAMYSLGRQARERNFKTVSCNVGDKVKRAWWLAGWHDLDIEKGCQSFFVGQDRIPVRSES